MQRRGRSDSLSMPDSPFPGLMRGSSIGTAAELGPDMSLIPPSPRPGGKDLQLVHFTSHNDTVMELLSVHKYKCSPQHHCRDGRHSFRPRWVGTQTNHPKSVTTKRSS